MKTVRLTAAQAAVRYLSRQSVETPDGVVMAVSHRERPFFGIQFHPESFGTGSGDRLILNFLGGLS